MSMSPEGLVVLIATIGTALIIAGIVVGARFSTGAPGRIGTVLTDGGMALLTGAVVGIVLVGVSDRLDGARSEAAERRDATRYLQDVRRDNIRYVRAALLHRTGDLHDPSNLARQREFGRLDLRGARLDGLDMEFANLNDAVLIGASLYSAKLAGASIARGRLDDAALDGAYLLGLNASHASLSRTSLQGADLRHADLSDADIRGADFTNAIVDRSTSFTGAKYDEDTIWWGSGPPPDAVKTDD